MTATMLSANPQVNTFAWLVRRELWESRGGFLRAPFIIAAVVLVLFVLSLVTADITAHRNGVSIGGLNIGEVLDKVNGDAADKFANGIDAGLLAMCFPIVIGLTFVVFFYLLGALYDDRKDRSVLFFKSLPISDTTTVLSKLVSGLIVAPLIALAACIALQLGFLAIMTVYAMLHGINAVTLLWHPVHLASLWTKMLVMLPINALWALPTAGWLLLCSSFVRSKPFLMAVLMPILAGIAIGFINLMQALALPSTTYWRYVFFRILGGLWPGTWLAGSVASSLPNGDSDVNLALALGKSDYVNGLLSFQHMGSALLSPELWFGVVGGAVLIAGAVYFRRERTDSYN